MKYFLTFLMVLSSFLVSAQTFNVDMQKSGLKWVGTKLTGTHVGKLDFESGSILYEGGVPKSANFTVNMDSLAVDDLQGEWADKLSNHLKSADFFDTKNFKTSTLSVTRISKLKGDDEYKFDGIMTIKGKTATVSFSGKMEVVAGDLSAKGKLIFDRTRFDIKYNSGKFFKDLGDKMIKDDIELVFTVNATIAPTAASATSSSTK